jgi:serine/threonine protein kinase
MSMLDSEALTRLGACQEGHFQPGGSLWYGATLAGRYKAEQFLGEGFHGSVHRALDLRTGAQMAVKQNIHHQQAVREARLLAAIQHPGVVSLSDFLYDERAAYLVLPFIEGLPLFAWTPEGHQPPLDVLEVLEVGWQLAATFTYLHSLPVVHRDLHSGNLYGFRSPAGGCFLVIVSTPLACRS